MPWMSSGLDVSVFGGAANTLTLTTASVIDERTGRRPSADEVMPLRSSSQIRVYVNQEYLR